MPLPALAIPALLKLGEGLIDRFFPDPKAANEAKLELLRMEKNGELAQLAAETDLAKGQLAINAAEAASSSVFVSGWRPFIGWTCGAAFAYKFVVAPAMLFALTALGRGVELPVLDFAELWPVLFGMLGLGAMRSYEKVKGVA